MFDSRKIFAFCSFLVGFFFLALLYFDSKASRLIEEEINKEKFVALLEEEIEEVSENSSLERLNDEDDENLCKELDGGIHFESAFDRKEYMKGFEILKVLVQIILIILCPHLLKPRKVQNLLKML